MKVVKDLTGQRFGRLVVISRTDDYVTPKGRHIAKWLCQCDCGNMHKATGCHLRSGSLKSCGCYNNECRRARVIRHGQSDTRLHDVWNSMRYRCSNPNNKGYHLYGERGIKVCNEWLGSDGFQNFSKWAFSNGYDESAPHGKCTIDRIDVNGNYEPSNCRWVSVQDQNNNRRSNRYLTLNGETRTLAQWARITGIGWSTILARIDKYGWSVKDALTVKVRGKRNEIV